MKTTLLQYLIVFILGLVLAYALTSKYGTHEKEIKIELIHDLKDLAHIKALEKMLIQHDTLWSRIRRHDLDSLKTIDNQRKLYETKYLRLKNAPVRRYSQPQLDSVIRAVVGF